MSQLNIFVKHWLSFGSRVQVSLHESLNFNRYKRVGSFFRASLPWRSISIFFFLFFFFKKGLFFWSLGLFLDLQGSHSNRLHVWLGSMATKGCDFIREESSMPRKIKIRVWKMSDQMHVFFGWRAREWNSARSWHQSPLRIWSHWVIMRS